MTDIYSGYKPMTDFLHIEYQNAVLVCTPLQPMKLMNSFGYETAFTRLAALQKELTTPQKAVGALCTVDFSRIDDYDSYCVVWLAAVKRLCARYELPLHIEGMSASMEQFVALLEKPLLAERAALQQPSGLREYVTQIGISTLAVLADARFFLEFLGEFVMNAVLPLWKPHKIKSVMRWEELPAQFMRSGVSAVPIVALIGLLMGVIVGYQGAIQLQQFGAEVYLADMVAVAMTRELAPLMTAIIVAGRSGAAFAAEIGTMQVSEEVDALTAMGFNIMRFLVMPRVLAVALAMPLLVLFSDIAGIIGGLFIGITVCKLSLSGYLNETRQALTYAHLFSGLGKSLVLGQLIALVGCMRGLQVRGGAESVGQYTTSSVVTGIFLIILADAVFTLLFQALGI